jgi:hypothetical protein
MSCRLRRIGARTLCGDGSPGAAIALTPLGRRRGRRRPVTAPVLTPAAISRGQEMRIVVLGPDRPLVHAHDRNEDEGHQDEIECENG